MSRQKKASVPTATATARPVQVGVRLDAALLARVDEEQERLRREAPHFNPTRSDALRSLVVRGLGVGPVGTLGSGGPIAVKGEV